GCRRKSTAGKAVAGEGAKTRTTQEIGNKERTWLDSLPETARKGSRRAAISSGFCTPTRRTRASPRFPAPKRNICEWAMCMSQARPLH
ncbi:unnamed protein product, partial [Ectocarpus sp. 13 AM-2016]